MKKSPKAKPATQPETKPDPAQPESQCRAAEVGHRSCGCPDCNHNAKRK